MASSPRPNKQILIVTGAHLSAELYDRPIAYRLRERVLHAIQESDGPEQVLVCSDLWYLNRDPLRELPTVSIGGPAVNALTAYLADKLPSVFAIDGQLVVQGDWDKAPLACCWGIDAERTAAAADLFAEKYLEAWLGALV
ncbi:MAG TPA: hypothetical protein VD997_11295 [Phycisphaerales bacterium]|nr:hypothetical protein [Phycisphaerales bacterium]